MVHIFPAQGALELAVLEWQSERLPFTQLQYTPQRPDRTQDVVQSVSTGTVSFLGGDRRGEEVVGMAVVLIRSAGSGH
jgi:hypothetical protein